MLTASFNGKPLLMTPQPSVKEESKNSKLMASPFSMSGNPENNSEEEVNKRKMRQEKYSGGNGQPSNAGGGLGF